MPASKHPKRAPKHNDRPAPPRVPRPTALDPSAAPLASTGRRINVASARSLADWPVHEAMVNDGWDEPGGLATVVVVRKHPSYDTLVIGTFLVDLQCLGVKDASYRKARDVHTYERRLRGEMIAHYPPLSAIAPALAAKIVTEGLVYADALGFKPHRDFTAARAVLDGLDPGADATPVVVGGQDGKPLFIAGPYDNVSAIMAQLGQRLGKDGFNSVIPLDADTEFLVTDRQGEPTDELRDALAWMDDDDEGEGGAAKSKKQSLWGRLFGK